MIIQVAAWIFVAYWGRLYFVYRKNFPYDSRLGSAFSSFAAAIVMSCMCAAGSALFLGLGIALFGGFS